jgi:Concanavalin A-like lectin/glucanases superfamily
MQRGVWGAVGILLILVWAAPGLAVAQEQPIAAYSFDEGEGEVAEDHAGSHDAAIEGAEWSEGKYGPALEFDGEENCVSVPNSVDLQLSQSFTLEAWVRPDHSQTFAPVFFKETESFYSYSLFVGAFKSGRPEGFISEDGTEWAEVASEEALPEKQWTHLALSSDGEILRLYIDGELIDTSSAVEAAESEGPLLIGCSKVFEEAFAGKIDEVRIYDRALSTEEIEDGMATAINPGYPHNLVEPTINQTPHEALEVKGTTGDWTGDELSFEYQWKRCDLKGSSCTLIEGATKSIYVPTGTDISHTLRLSVVASNALGAVTLDSEPSHEVLPTPPIFLEKVAVDGDLKQGSTLEANLAGLRGSPAVTLEYEWQRCDEICSPIPGAGGSSYKLTTVDIAKMIVLKVTAKNELDTATSLSDATGPIEPVETEGAPVAVERPRLGGLYRITDTLGSTDGQWLGAGSIAKTIKWQRCNADLTSCEDIEGATDRLYEPSSQDEGSRLRTVVNAENVLGSSTMESIATPPILPVNNTAFKVEGPQELRATLEALESAEITLLSLTYGSETASLISGYSSNQAQLLEELEKQFGSGVGEEQVDSFVLKGSVDQEELGELQSSVSAEEEPSLRAHEEPEGIEAEDFVTYAIPSAKLRSVQETSPSSDMGLESEFFWVPDLEEFLTRIYEVGSPLALEFDVKLYNQANANVSIEVGGVTLQGICLPWETNNFWVGNRDDVSIETEIPASAGLYWDTASLDSCKEKDLTFGVYHPESLEGLTPYATNVYFLGDDAVGDTAMSEINWSVQLLGEHCDSSPNCVNIPYVDIDGETAGLINVGEEFEFYYDWGHVLAPATMPWCYEYRDPALLGGSILANEFGAGPCVWLK